jgi:hypothetical protein
VHDRRIKGTARIFGNQGWLYMRAMTWWDHETGSIWSQPIGAALVGPLRGTKLQQLPAALVPWASWRAEHPSTLVLQEERGFGFFYERPQDNFVIGVALGEAAKAYYWRDLAKARLINDKVGAHPILVYADPSTRRVQTWLRTVGNSTLTFALRDGRVIDQETGSTWEPLRGISIAGPRRGDVLRTIPHNSSYDWAWRDFYPQTAFYRP